MLLLVTLTVLLVGVTVFVLQNADGVSIRFLYWNLHASSTAAAQRLPPLRRS
jgi:uncharacterized integral membrane protein